MKTTTVVAVLLAASVASAKDVVKVKGSETLAGLVESWADEFAKRDKSIGINAAGGGSSSGVNALLTGVTDIATLSRPLKKGESDKLRMRFKTVPVEVPVARDALTFYVHPSNKVKALTLEQLKKICTGEITNWKDVGGDDAPITLIERDESSGTHEFLKETLLKKAEFAETAMKLTGNAAVVSAVGRDPHAIGYGAAAYAKGKVRPLSIRVNDAEIAATPETVKTGKYPLTRNLYFDLRTPPTGATKTFVDYVLSPEGQQLATTAGFFPVK